MFLCASVIISSLQWSANAIHLAKGQLVDMLHSQHPQKIQTVLLKRTPKCTGCANC